MKPYYEDESVTIWHGDCLDVLREMPDNSVDAVVCDPPYGLEFMGKEWDSFKPGGKRPTMGKADGSPHRRNAGTPSWGASGNPGCRKCGGQRYGSNPDRQCSCERPDFGNPMAAQMRAFQEWCEQWAAECLRVLKPGGHMLAFGGTRTWHRLAVAVEDAGFEVRDSIAWLYGSGFPKSLDVSKTIDKQRDDSGAVLLVTWAMLEAAEAKGITRADVNEHMGTTDMAGWWLSRLRHRSQVPTWDQWLRLKAFLGMDDSFDAEVWRLNGRKGTPGEAWGQRAVVGERRQRANGAESSVALNNSAADVETLTAPATPAAQQWQGWGTALKPAFEPVVVARKPLIGTVAANVLAHGTGALNVDGTRIHGEDAPEGRLRHGGGSAVSSSMSGPLRPDVRPASPAGRWPTNVVLDGDAAAELDEQSGDRPGMTPGVLRRGATTGTSIGGKGAYGTAEPQEVATGYGDSGGASRFFPVFRYQAKAPTRERVKVGDVAHPTVKPLALMRWLVRLVTPPGGVVLDPFAGSGTTIEAAILEGFQVIGIEREADYLPLIEARIARNRPEVEESELGEELALFDLDGDAA